MKPLEIKPQPFRTEVRADGRVCVKCHEFYLWASYLRDLTASTGRGSTCKTCRAKRKK